VDEGWGRRAADFATLSEPYNCREYVVVHHRLGVDEGHRLLDVACGSGLALELAHLRGAVCAGIDASQRLVAVACDRNPSADIRVGDMHASGHVRQAPVRARGTRTPGYGSWAASCFQPRTTPSRVRRSAR
jgi:SAM-dependent methyltransferase